MTTSFNKIFFDFDSTLIRAEGIDMLAERCGVGAQVKKMTERSMNGEVPMEQVFIKKVNLVSPTRAQALEVAEACKGLITEGAPDVVRALHSLGKEVYIISSGFHTIIDPIAEAIGIPLDHVIANTFYFDDAGNYLGLDETSPLVTSAGKVAMIKPLIGPTDRTVFVVDGATDASTKGTVDVFVGFGGVVERPAVRAAADAYCASSNLLDLLPILLTPAERARLH